MIAMQYSFTLPADYDMALIDRRIAEKGHLLDHFPNLLFKAYLSAAQDAGDTGSRENLYAPFYVWQNATGMSDFLCGEGFAGLTRSFGWPQVRTWAVWQAHLAPDAAKAVFATREILATEPYAPLADLRQRESEDAVADVESGGALASVAAFEPATWTRLRFRLWGEAQPPAQGAQAYRVGHVSRP